MKERQRWQAEEDMVLSDYVKQYGPRDWHLVSQRMGTLLDRDAKSCVERWKNYLKPGIKKGPLSDEEQQLVISLQAKYGNKWKKIAAEVPGRTAKRLGKWWEVYKDKQQKEKEKDRPRFAAGAGSTEGTSNYTEMLANLADKFGQRPLGSTVLPTPPFPMPALLGPPAIAPLALIGTPMAAGRPSGPSAVGILTSKLPSFDAHTSLPLATLAVPVSVMTTAIGSWLSTAINVSQCTSTATPTVDLDVKAVPMEVTTVRGLEAHPATTTATKTAQGPSLGPAAADGTAASTPESSQPSASGGSSSLPAWMSNVPSSAARTPAVGSDGQTTASAAPPSTSVAATGARAGSVSSHNSQVATSLSISPCIVDTVVPGAPSSDPAFVLAQRAWLQSTLSWKEGGPRDKVVDAGVSTQPAWCSINPQMAGQIPTGPNLVLSRPMPTPEMATGGNHWLQFLECCKELEEGRQYWYAQRKESSWRVKRLEAKLESEKMQRWKQKMEEVEASIISLRADEYKFFEDLEADYKEKILSLHREEEQKDAKIVEMWTAKHTQLTHFLEQVMHHPPPLPAPPRHSGPGPIDKP